MILLPEPLNVSTLLEILAVVIREAQPQKLLDIVSTLLEILARGIAFLSAPRPMGGFQPFLRF